MYTNGINITSVQDALYGRIGWEQSTKSGAPVVSTENKASVSGRYFQEFHPLVTVENIKASQENPDITDDQLNTLLESRVKSSITKSLVNVYEDTQMLEKVLLYERTGDNDILENNSDRFVGYEINVARDYSKKTQVVACELYFDTEVTFNLYLFKDGVATPVKTQSVTTTAGSIKRVTLDDVYLGYEGVSKYYLGYFQNDIGSAKAYKENVYSKEKTFCFSADSMYSERVGSNFNRDSISYPDQPIGLNLEIIAFNDITEIVLNNPSMFDNAIGYNVAIWALELMLNNTRSSNVERMTKEMVNVIYRDLNQVTTAENPFNSGLKSILKNEYKRLKELVKATPKATVNEYCKGNNGWHR